jgi:hypothetical protein
MIRMSRQELLIISFELVALITAVILMARGVALVIVLPVLAILLIAAGFALMRLARNRRMVEETSFFNHPLMNAIVYPALILYSFWNLWSRIR